MGRYDDGWEGQRHEDEWKGWVWVFWLPMMLVWGWFVVETAFSILGWR